MCVCVCASCRTATIHVLPVFFLFSETCLQPSVHLLLIFVAWVLLCNTGLILRDFPVLHTHPFKGFFPGTTRVSQYQKGKTNLDFTEARDSEWQWHQLGHMQVCISLQTDNHAITPPLSFLQSGCLSCCPTNSVNALKVGGQKVSGISH